jgi:hypothetical protein
MLPVGADLMTSFLVFPQSVSVQIESNNPEALALRVIERATNHADTRIFEFRMTRGELLQLRDEITTELSKGQLPE